MSLTGMVYRPPYEANSLLLQVTQGCSHNKCTFCYMYPDVPFTVCPMEQVEADIEEATSNCPDVERVFLEHGDAFVLSADRLIQIADAIHARLPQVKTIAMYASIQNIRQKTDAELRRLHECGIGGLDIGVESGLDAALKYMNKGHTAEEAKEQLLRLTDAGIEYSFNAILGCGGAELWRENADATAALMAALPSQDFLPSVSFERTLCLPKGMPMRAAAASPVPHIRMAAAARFGFPKTPQHTAIKAANIRKSISMLFLISPGFFSTNSRGYHTSCSAAINSG